MVEQEQLAAALGRLDPREREVLDWSLRRRVPDEDLAELYRCEPGDVARRRAGALERLSEELDVKRGEELGGVLKALLEAETWEGVDRDYGVAVSEGQPAIATPPPEPEAEPGVEGIAAAADEEEQSQQQQGEQPHVLEMLTPQKPTQADPPPPPEPERQKRSRTWRSLALAAGVGVALGTGGVVAAATFSEGDDGGGGKGSSTSQTRPFAPQKADLGEPFPTDPASANRHPTALVRGATVLYERPGGKKKIRIPGRTDWGTPRILGVVRRSGGWLAVQAPELGNGEIGWIRASTATLGSVSYSVHVDVSKRTVEVRRDGKRVRRFRVAVGRRDHPTPTGRFSVTDKLKVSNSTSVYGCCVLALSGHQTKLPEGWPGGDRLAIHATRNPATIGHPVSLGCMRAKSDDARWLINKVPLGTPVFIKA